MKKESGQPKVERREQKEAKKKEEIKPNIFAIKNDMVLQAANQKKGVHELPKLKNEQVVENPLKEIVKPVQQKQIPSVTPAMSTRKMEQKSKEVRDKIQAFDMEEFSNPSGVDRNQNQTPKIEGTKITHEKLPKSDYSNPATPARATPVSKNAGSTPKMRTNTESSIKITDQAMMDAKDYVQ